MEKTRLYEIFTSPEKGRGLRASYDIVPGIDIFNEKPMAYTLTNSKTRGTHCDYCFSCPENLFKCGKCKYTAYCGKECQLNDWLIHKQECRCLLKVLPKQPPDLCRLVSHVLFKYYLPSKKKNLNIKSDIEELMSNSSLITNTRKEAFFTFAAVLNDYLKESPVDLKNVDIFGLLCRISCNSFTITCSEMNSLGTGVYKTASLLNHSCSPNAIALFDGTEIGIRSIKHISQGDEIMIAYVNLLDLRVNRQNNLMEGYMFTCKCELCTKSTFSEFVMNSIICEDCQPVRCVQPSEDIDLTEKEKRRYQQVYGGAIIKKCTFDYETANRALAMADELEALYQSVKIIPSIDQFNRLLSLIARGECQLGPANIYLVHCYEIAMDGCLEQNDWRMAYEYARKLEKAYLLLLPQNHPSIGLHYFKQGKLAMLLDELRDGMRCLQQAKKYISITHGKDHAYIKTLEKSLYEASQEMKTIEDNSIIERIYNEMNQE